MTLKFPLLASLAVILIAGATVPCAAQTPVRTKAAATQEEIRLLTARADSALQLGRLDNLVLFAPRHFSRAQSAFDEARSLQDRERDRNLIRIKLQLCLDEAAAARDVAVDARREFQTLVAARSAAQTEGAPDHSPDAWRRAEEKLRGLFREFERNPKFSGAAEAEQITGIYLAARRDALRVRILGTARERLAQMDKKGGAKNVPALVLRTEQAISRAEAAIAQENLDLARVEAAAAARAANHALALMDYIDAARRQKPEWEHALLPYDDLLQEVAGWLGGSLDFSRGGLVTRNQFQELIRLREDSLREALADQSEQQRALEQSLADAQTSLSQAQDRIAQLERRLGTVETERTTAREALQQKSELADRVERAQLLFKPGEAVVQQTAEGYVMIRVQGIQFGSGATNLTRTHQTLLNKVVEAVALFPGAAVRVDGHTDADGGDRQNLELSEKRAEAVAEYLAAQMPKAGEIQFTGFGESKPIADNNTREGKARNRRIEILLANFR